MELKLKKILFNTVLEVILLFAGSLLFSFAFPSFLTDWGWGILGFVALAPTFILLQRVGWVKSVIYGLAYGFFTYRIFNFWLAEFNPVGYMIVPVIYAGYFGLFFPLFKWGGQLSKKWGWLIQSLFWLLFEVVRTKGFVGYSYGILGYSQYRFLSLIGISDITGVLGVSAMVIMPSALIAKFFAERKEFSLAKLKPLAIYGSLFLLVNIYGLLAMVDYSESPTLRTALIQHNEDTWLSGVESYKKSYEILERLSTEAKGEDPDLVIWPETAFVPAIEWHEKYRQEPQKLVLIKKLRAYLKEYGKPFIIGNNDTRKIGGERKTWNSVYQMVDGEIAERYHKIHLVPFGETFPYEKTMPWLYDYIVDLGAQFYEKGDEWTVFEQDGVKFSSMICYEDAFPYLGRNFTLQGAELFVNITNDAWSQANASCMQHGTIAVFRSVENRRSMVRSTCSGFTSVISPNGEILAYIEPFTEDYLVYDTPIYAERTTLFTRVGDWFEVLIVALSLGLIAFVVIGKIRRKQRER